MIIFVWLLFFKNIYLSQILEQFLSMKLAAVNPRLDFNFDNLFAREVKYLFSEWYI
jgi:hypothetical protein